MFLILQIVQIKLISKINSYEKWSFEVNYMYI